MEKHSEWYHWSTRMPTVVSTNSKQFDCVMRLADRVDCYVCM